MFQSRVIVQAHGGSIQVESETGKGTHVSREPSRSRTRNDENQLLIVDDDEDIRTQMKWALGVDYEVLIGRGPRGRMAAFTANRPGGDPARSGTAAPPQRTRRGTGGALGGCSRWIRWPR